MTSCNNIFIQQKLTNLSCATHTETPGYILTTPTELTFLIH